MGTVKLELDIPDFNDELSITITVKKDGEVVVDSSPSPSTVRKTPKKNIVKETSSTPTISGGNLMNLEI